MLKGKKAGMVKVSKPKFMISGRSGVGKTMFALEFPNPYLIDTEKGAERKPYQEKLSKVNGAYMGREEGSGDFRTVIDEIQTLATTKHSYKTLIIDSFSYLYIMEAAAAEAKGGSEFGRDKKAANQPTRQLMRWIDNIDMTVILVCHAKDKWVRQGKEVAFEGTTFDGYDKLEFLLDLWIEIQLNKDNRFFYVKKSRIELFPMDSTFPLSYTKFADLYGREVIEKEPTPVLLATQEQIKRVKELVEVVRIEETEVEKWFVKASVDNWSEMKAETIQKCIDYLQAKVKEVSEPSLITVAGQPIKDFSAKPEKERIDLLAKCEKAKKTLGKEIFAEILKTFKEDSLDRLDNGELASLVTKCNVEYRVRELGKKKGVKK